MTGLHNVVLMLFNTLVSYYVICSKYLWSQSVEHDFGCVINVASVSIKSYYKIGLKASLILYWAVESL